MPTTAENLNGSGSSWRGLYDQFGRIQRVTDDPAWQRPGDPLENLERTRATAKAISREIPNVIVDQAWTPPKVRSALSDLVVGLFDAPAQLQDSLNGDSRVQSAMRSRSSGLLGQPMGFYPPKKAEELGRKVCRRWEKHWENMNAEPALLELLDGGNSLGFSYSQTLWDTGGKTWLPYLQPWNARYSYFHWLLRLHVAITMDGQEPITPGDAHWVLHAPYGAYRGWMRGAIRAVAQWWLARNYALRDWARYSERHGFPMLLADTPFGADTQDIANFTGALQNLGQETLLQLPGSVESTKYGKYDLRTLEPKDRNWQTFKELIQQCNAEITQALLGQNLTSEIKEGSMAAARVHAHVLQAWLEADARSLARTLYVQVLRPFAALNYGDANLAPMPRWNVAPPEDMKTKAETLKAFGEGVNQMRLGGVRVKNLPRFAKRFGLDLGDIEHVDPIQVEARLAGKTGEVDAVEPVAKVESLMSRLEKFASRLEALREAA